MIQGLLRSLLPRRCPGCQGQLGASAGLCPECLGALRPQLQRFSLLRAGSEPGLLVLGPYQGMLGRSVRALKYGGSRELAAVLGARLAEGIPAGWQVRAVCAVPLHAARLRERGFNQAELLGRAVAARLGVPYLELLGRERADIFMGVPTMLKLMMESPAFAAADLSSLRYFIVGGEALPLEVIR
ncbi:MAG: AMP-binding protein, partial [Deinococcus sp.]